MTVTTYQSAYCSLAHWATASYVDAKVGGMVSDKEGMKPCFGYLWVVPDPLSSASSVHKTRQTRPRLQRSKSDSTVGQRKHQAVLCNSWNPFVARELPRGKFCSFPQKITKFPFIGIDPLGFTSYGQEKARARAFPAGSDAVYGSPSRQV
ncbi:unnamed protein product [Cladocopium goreaui]|uniref:Uncharacterized protein n=1 Tax=Cladocopium goreaui TaxID=2562237 RepID=A0A9P1D6H6_9DINO|nr:unnamed protein product [Cladocopium goreaui]